MNIEIYKFALLWGEAQLCLPYVLLRYCARYPATIACSSMRAAAVLLGVQTAAPQFAIGRHKAQKSQEIPYITKKDERDNSEAKRKCDLGNSGIITLREETVS